jgi:phage shock protein PspC (stress-responsive transcriptional regulator)
MDGSKDPGSRAIAFGGAALIVFGLWWLARGIIPPAILDIINRSAGALTLIGLGVAVIVLSRRVRVNMPRSGTRLYRSRTDKMLGGVLGGLGAYLGVDPLVLRIAAVLLGLMSTGTFVIAYVVLWVLVPEDPFPAVSPGSAPPAPPAPGA